ncbi:MAG: hypothetical protein BGO78_00055 [Chloroflexi bacterium 44-23]|nr:MAG: hypothetical protein BGO78_00055 [Chloroflexi bacterium 44-23]
MTTILLDATSLPKNPVGAGIYIINLVRELLRMNSDFDFKVLAHEDDFPLFRLGDDSHSQFIFLPDRGRGWRILAEQLYYPRLCQRFNAEIYHGLHYSFPLMGSTPKVITIHDLSFFVLPKKHNFLKRLYFPFFIRKANKLARHILVVSENTRQDLLKYTDTDPEKITVTPLGVDQIYFDPVSPENKDAIREKYGLPPIYILFVGLIEPRKNVPLLIDTYLKLMESDPSDVDLVIAGRWGWQSREFLNQYEPHPYFSRVHFPGYIENADLPALYQMASLFVYPSSYEGFGLPVLEAMASGLTVITTKVSSMPEFVGTAGMMVEPNNSELLKAAMKTLLADKPERDRLGALAKLIAQEYTWKKTAEKTISAYKKVLSGRGD